MLRSTFLGLAFVCSSAEAGPLHEWEQPHTLDLVNKSIAALAHTCVADFGFEALPAPPEDQARDQLHAYLELSGEPEVIEQQWLSLMQHRYGLVAKNGTVTQRASDAIGAAVDDPSTYAEAERLYVDTLEQGAREALADCRSASDDPYIGKHYLSGGGTVPVNEERLKKDFADAVKDVGAYKAKVMPRRRK